MSEIFVISHSPTNNCTTVLPLDLVQLNEQLLQYTWDCSWSVSSFVESSGQTFPAEGLKSLLEARTASA